MALRATFEKTIAFPSRHALNSKSIKPEYTRFWDDINRYSLAHVGMAYTELTQMRDALGLSGADLDTMMQTYDNKKSHGGDFAMAMALPLPDGIEATESFTGLP